jgi:hypothetical protein
LSTIREQEKKLLLYRTIIDKMSRIVPRSCNYSNIEKIIEQARYDEDKNQYWLPEPTREEVSLPHMNNGRDHALPSKFNSTTTEYEDDFIDPDNGYNSTSITTNSDDTDRRYARNLDSTNNLPPERTRIKRQEQLLNESSLLQRTKRPLQMNNDNDYMNRRLNPYEAPARLSRKYGFSSDKQ